MTGVISEVKVEGAHVKGAPDRVAQPGRALKASAERGLGEQVLVDESDCRDCRKDVERDMFEGAERNIEVQLAIGTTLVT